MNLTNKTCVPCKGNIPPMNEQDEDRYIREINQWTLLRNGTHRIAKQFKFGDFKQSMRFVNQIANLAESEGHHPDICIHYSIVDIELFTHAIGGLHENDFIVAAKIDQLAA